MRPLLLLLSLLVGAQAVFAADATKPMRVVTMNLCADELVLLLADREQIRSVSWLVKEPGMSASGGAAQGIEVNHGLAEEIIVLDPDLVITGEFSNPATNAVLNKLGYRVMKLTLATTVPQIRAQVIEVAEALGQSARGEQLVQDMDARLVTEARENKRLSAIVYEPNGYVAGDGSLADTALKAAGLDNLASKLDLVSYNRFPLELLILHRPDVLVLNTLDDELPSMAEVVQHHPVIASAFGPDHVVSIPRQSWSCGNPNFLMAVDKLRNAVDRIVATSD